MQNDVVSELAQRVGPDVVVEPDAQNVLRHAQDFGVRVATQSLQRRYVAKREQRRAV